MSSDDPIGKLRRASERGNNFIGPPQMYARPWTPSTTPSRDTSSSTSSRRSSRFRRGGGNRASYSSPPTDRGIANRPLPESHTLDIQATPTPKNKIHPRSRGTTPHVNITHCDSEAFDASSVSTLDVSRSQTAETDQSNANGNYSVTEVSCDLPKGSIQEDTPDESTETVFKLPDEFLQNINRLLLQALGGDGWHRSTDGSLQYIVVVRHGKLYVWERRSGEYRTLDELLSSSVWSKAPNSAASRASAEGLSSVFVTRNASFFTIGTVFRTLFTEPCTDPRRKGASPSISTVRFGEKVYSQLVTFVVVQLGRGYCYACRISDYEGQATLKAGCNPSEHAAVYIHGNQPSLLPGETGMTKMAIEVVPSSTDSEGLNSRSRIRFGRGQAIQCNVKAEEIGHVAGHHISRLTTYWREEMCGRDCNGEVSTIEAKSAHRAIVQTTEIGPENQSEVATDNCDTVTTSENAGPINSTGPRRDVYVVNGIENVIITEVGGALHSSFEDIQNPRGFFKKGRAFMIYWPELAGSPESERTIYWKIRRFVVIRSRSTFCLCLLMSTYQGRGTTKAGITIEDHAPVLPVDGELRLEPEEQGLKKDPLYIKIEDPTITIDPMSRIHLGKVFTVEYNLKVRKIGRVVPESIRKMEEYFLEAFKV